MTNNDYNFARAEETWLTPPEAKEIVAGQCSHCRVSLYVNDECYRFEENLFCDKDCFCDWIELEYVDCLEKEC